MFNLPTLITEDSLIKSMNIEALVLNPVAKGVGSLVVLSSDSATEKIVKLRKLEMKTSILLVLNYSKALSKMKNMHRNLLNIYRLCLLLNCYLSPMT